MSGDAVSLGRDDHIAAGTREGAAPHRSRRSRSWAGLVPGEVGQMSQPSSKPDPLLLQLAERLRQEQADLEAELAALAPIRRRLQQMRASLRVLDRLESDPGPPRHRYDA
jgi:hypothetical protein